MEFVDEVLARLIELKFFKFTPATELNQAIVTLRANFTKYKIIDTDDGLRDTFIPYDRRIYFADAEELAEGGVCDFLEKMKPVLALERIQFRSLRDETRWDEQGNYSYHIFIDGKRYKIYDDTEDGHNSWCWAHKRTIEIINEFLRAASSEETAYAQATGNDASVALLNDALYSYIRSLPINENSMPRRTDKVECD